MSVVGGFDKKKPVCPQCGHDRNVEWVNVPRSGIDAEGRMQTYLAAVPRCRIHGELKPE